MQCLSQDRDIGPEQVPNHCPRSLNRILSADVTSQLLSTDVCLKEGRHGLCWRETLCVLGNLDEERFSWVSSASREDKANPSLLLSCSSSIRTNFGKSWLWFVPLSKTNGLKYSSVMGFSYTCFSLDIGDTIVKWIQAMRMFPSRNL